MKQLATVLVPVVAAALTYIVAAWLWSGDLSQPGLLPLVAGLAVGSLVAGLSYKARQKKRA